MAAIVLPADHPTYDAHPYVVGGDPSDRGQSWCDTHSLGAAVTPCPSDHTVVETQVCYVAGAASPADHTNADAHTVSVGGIFSGEDDNQTVAVAQHPSAVVLPRILDHASPDQTLLLCSDLLDGLERLRIDMENRLRAFEGENLGTGGKGLSGTAEAELLRARVAQLVAMEHEATLDLQHAMRKHPLGPWVKRTLGVGEKQAARLLAVIGDPADRATVSQLWAYCGYHVLPVDHPFVGAQSNDVDGQSLDPSHKYADNHSYRAGVEPSGGDTGQPLTNTHLSSAGVAPRRKRGEKANWNPKAKSRAWVIAKQAVMLDGQADKNGKPRPRSPYRDVYDDRKATTEGRVHAATCRNQIRSSPGQAVHASNGCGTSEHPEWGEPGSPWRPGHRQADALRVTAKAVLRDMWIEARRIRGEK